MCKLITLLGFYLLASGPFFIGLWGLEEVEKLNASNMPTAINRKIGKVVVFLSSQIAIAVYVIGHISWWVASGFFMESGYFWWLLLWRWTADIRRNRRAKRNG